MIQILIGTKAQYIKTAPLIRELDRVDTPYRLIDTGQHGSFAPRLRGELRVREPDYRLGSDADVKSVGQALLWALRIVRLGLNKRRLRAEVFGGYSGVCVVHGDTPSTLLATWMAKRAGLDVAHLEAGLRSRSLINPFPEELIRIAVMKWADLLFAPSLEARRNLEEMGVRGEVVELPGNSVIEALSASSGHVSNGGAPKHPVVVTCHRVENLNSRSRMTRLVELAAECTRSHPVVFVLHPPTGEALGSAALERLTEAGIEMRSLMPHREFVALLRSAEFVVTDGGSIQEECALLGVPTLLWRKQTERPDGLDVNVVLSGFQEHEIHRFLRGYKDLRAEESVLDARPSAVIAEKLVARA